jgi:FKBP-type peptidyl-prolyl cis-trans isomerase SlyD
MQVEENKIVILSYQLRENDPEGELLEEMSVHYPFKFFFGTGQLLPAFEEQLEGLKEGDPFEFTLIPEHAYGPTDPEGIIALPRNLFEEEEVNGPIEAGQYITLHDEEGYAHPGVVLSIGEEEVIVDFNHAMAGKTLHFKGVILKVREATVEELIRKSYIEEDGINYLDWEN